MIEKLMFEKTTGPIEKLIENGSFYQK